MSEEVAVLILPGWPRAGHSGAAHWLSSWQTLYGYQRVEQADWDHPLRGDWMARLEEVVLLQTRPVVFAAHSLGCHLVAAWAAHSQNTSRVHGALLVAPTDTERPNMPPQVSSWRRIERQRLPFAALLVYSQDDPFCDAKRATGMATAWGAHARNLGQAGHIDAYSDLGDWPAGRALLRSLGA